MPTAWSSSAPRAPERSRPWAARGLVLEAAVHLVAAKLALRVLPFRRLTRLFSRVPRRPELQGDERARVRDDVARSIQVAAERLPRAWACFPRAIAAQAMLRRRGVGTVLYYGAATLPGRGLSTHVWLLDGDVGVAGHVANLSYHVLARYPPAD